MQAYTSNRTLKYALQARSSQLEQVSKRLRIVGSVLGLALFATLLSSIVLLKVGIENSEAAKALLSINILGTLLCFASVYSLVGVFWNAYWVEREKRVEAQVDLRETEESMPYLFQGVLAELPKMEAFQQQVGSDHSRALEVAALLTDAQVVAKARMTIAERSLEMAEEGMQITSGSSNSPKYVN